MKKNQKIIKNILSINSIPQPQPRANEIKIAKKTINDSLSHSLSNIQSNKHLENNFKDSLEASISESKTNLLIPDSLNNTKSSIGNLNNKKNNKKKIESYNHNNNIDKCDNDEKDSSAGNNNEESTKKIDYRFYTNYPIVLINNNIHKIKNKEKNRYWFAVYDKLMKRKKLLKILNYYDKERNKNENKINIDINQICQEPIKEQLLIIKDFDIYFIKQENKPFIKYIKGNCIFTKLYLLTVEEMNLILNYINRYKLSISSYSIKALQQKGNYQKLNENYKHFPYNMIYHMGNYMNINIYGFSNYNLHENNNISYNYLNQKFPSSKKIAKLVKLLMINFPKYSFNFFVCYLLSKIRFENFNEKTKEIKSIVYSGDISSLPLHNRYFNDKLINNSIIHSSYSPLSNYEDNTSNEKPILKDYTENNYQEIIGKNMTFDYHTYDNYNYKFYNNNKKHNNNYNNKNIRNENDSDKKRILKRHTESVYLNGYIGKENKLNFKKTKEKNKMDEKHSIKQIITNIRPSLLINDHINKKKKDKNINTIKNKSFSQNNKINFPNFVQVKKKNTNYIDNGILKQRGIFSINNECEAKEMIIIDESNNKSKSNINHLTSKIVMNTKSEETKIGTINKDMYINNSCKEEINRENTGIFVVSKRMATDIHDYIDDDSSLMISNKNFDGQSSIYMTPEKKKKYRYYS